MLNSTWLKEFASESNTIQAQEDIMQARVMASNIRPKLYMNLRWLFDHISGSMYSFELLSFVDLDMVSLLPWIAAGSSRKSIWEILGEDKVRLLDENLTDFMLRGR